ncbi:MAG: Mu-like prophage protein gp29/Mu-like prophage protein gp29 [Verrucomicrobia bacterium]|nr:MAG: Mu-like prophage protein gp29/Mu-like prophage protein gp29 [Verrucomicrobiota bacterium]
MSQFPQDKSPSKAGVVRRLGRIFNRAIEAVSYRLHVSAANLWRDNYNPLRSLTIARAVHLLEDGERGAYADLQWTYRYIEMQDATLGALVERRTSAIQEMDWDIKVTAKLPAGKEAVAKKQAAALSAAYNKITNLSAAIEALAMASFRGFTRLEKVTNDAGEIIELAAVDQWFWVRRGLYGEWQLNSACAFGATTGEPVPEPRFISREVSRPINRVALVAFVRKSLSQKDWDGFIEAFGIPAVFIIMPDDVPADKSDEYLEMADQVTSDARGVLPGGSDVKTVDNGARGVNPFKDHIAYQDEQVVLRGTGGKLTMLAESGSGTLAGGAHTDTFKAIARAEAMEISEILRKCLDADILALATPGEPAYAYFELAANEEMDPAQVVKDLVQLESAGLETDEAWIAEKTGYPVKRRIVAPASVRMSVADSPAMDAQVRALETGTAPIHNRADDYRRLVSSSLATALGVQNTALKPISGLIDGLASASQTPGMSDAEFLQFVENAAATLPELFDPAAAMELSNELEAAMGTAVLNGVRSSIHPNP